jgi:hypothetical protein
MTTPNQDGPTPRRSMRAATVAKSVAQSAVSVTPSRRSKVGLPKLTARQSTAYGSAGRVVSAEELEVPDTGFTNAFDNHRGTAATRADASVLGNNNGGSPSHTPTGAFPFTQAYESDNDEPQHDYDPAEESAADTSKSYGMMREAGMMRNLTKPQVPGSVQVVRVSAPAKTVAHAPTSLMGPPRRPTAPTGSQAKSRFMSGQPMAAQPPTRDTSPEFSRYNAVKAAFMPWLQHSWFQYVLYGLAALAIAMLIVPLIGALKSGSPPPITTPSASTPSASTPSASTPSASTPAARVSDHVDNKVLEVVEAHSKELHRISLQSLALTNMGIHLKKANFFSSGLDAVINEDLTSPTYTEAHPAWFNRVGRNLMTAPTRRPPSVALERWDEIGDCWCAAPNVDEGQNYVQLAVKMGYRIRPNQITIEHAPKQIAPNQDVSSAPKHVELWVKSSARARKDGVDNTNCVGGGMMSAGWVCLGSVTYDIYATNYVQSLYLPARVDDYVDEAIVLITKTWGAKRACIYRVRLHGEEAGAPHDYGALTVRNVEVLEQ